MGGEIRKGWNVGQGDLCGVEVSDNLSESSSLWIVRLVKAYKGSLRNFEKRHIKHGLKVRIRASRRRGPRKGRTQSIQFQ